VSAGLLHRVSYEPTETCWSDDSERHESGFGDEWIRLGPTYEPR